MTESIKNFLGDYFHWYSYHDCSYYWTACYPRQESKTILSPSIFAQNGTMPIAFTIYGIFAYSLIAALFLLIRKRNGRGTVSGRGCDTALPAAPCGTVYLWEPLPHVVPLDRITYPVADGLALIVMGPVAGLAVRAYRAVCKKNAAGRCSPFPYSS